MKANTIRFTDATRQGLSRTPAYPSFDTHREQPTGWGDSYMKRPTFANDGKLMPSAFIQSFDSMALMAQDCPPKAPNWVQRPKNQQGGDREKAAGNPFNQTSLRCTHIPTSGRDPGKLPHPASL